MSKFFSLVFSRQALIVVIMLLMAAIIWFLGPLLAVGGLHPLASMPLRATVIALLCLLAVCLRAPVAKPLFAVATACALVWFFGPTLSFGQAQPLTPVIVRISLMAMIVLLGALVVLLPRLRQRANQQRSSSQANHADMQHVTRAINFAAQRLKSLRGMHPLRWLLGGKRYLYQYPWYLVIGLPNSGKTWALINSGLRIPPTGQLQDVIVAGNNQTAHCDIWLAPDAVMIDTAGHYTLQTAESGKDRTEWQGLLALLRQKRELAPINGVIVALDMGELIMQTPEQRLVYAAQMRTRLEQLRSELGIGFPCYVIVTKTDVLEGFAAYFSSLLPAERAQAWGIGLPDNTDPGDKISIAIQRQCQHLLRRLEDGVPQRLLCELAADAKTALTLLPREFEAIIDPLSHWMDAVFDRDAYGMRGADFSLRGVYFTSAAQTHVHVPAGSLAIAQRHRAAQTEDQPATRFSALREAMATAVPDERRSYFLSDVFHQIIIPQAHLVQANRRALFRLNLQRLIGYAIIAILFAWLAGALMLSSVNNRAYLQAVAEKSGHLKQRVGNLFAALGDEKMHAVPDTLSAAQELPLFKGLNLDDPAGNFRYGLYAAPPIAEAAHNTYARLQDSLLLPHIVARMEADITTAIRNKDSQTAYDTLRVYLQLHDKGRYNASDLKTWLQHDSAENNSAVAVAFGNNSVMAAHMNTLFSGQRVVQSPFLQNLALVAAARKFLGDNPSTRRLYARAKIAMQDDAPPEFTLHQVIGPQAGTVFSRASGEPLGKGIPGLFTYDGYHDVFDKRLPEFVRQARLDDAWVMGDTSRHTSDTTKAARTEDVLMQDIRRQYLEEYAQQWVSFLDDIRTITGSNLSFDLTVLRAFAAPDSPLSRLARAAARETTLSRPLAAKSEADKNFFDKATDTISQKSQAVLGMSAQAKQEKELVDNHFAALREVVTGQADIALVRTPGSGDAVKPGLENISALLNAYYTLLVVADNALNNKSLPPNSIEAGMRLKLEGDKLPAPFKAILAALADSGTRQIADGVAAILRVQAQQQVDLINDMLASQVTHACQQSIAGRYPFAASAQEVSLDDFARLFGTGNAADVFFQKQLAPFVDTSRRPWRYKNPAVTTLLSPADAMIAGAGAPMANPNASPTLLSELLTLLAQQGPNPDRFAQMQVIHDVFFQDPSSKKMSWKVNMKMSDLDTAINELIMDFDGKQERYAHGPVRSFTVNWPGPDGGKSAEMRVTSGLRSHIPVIATNGPWALFRLLERGTLREAGVVGQSTVSFDFEGYKARIGLDMGNLPNPLLSHLLKDFSCPGSN